MHFIIHHPGKAGEVFLGLPMARLLKEYYPECRITWVVLDLYRDSIGKYPYIDAVETIPTTSCRNLSDVNAYMSKHRYYACQYQRVRVDPAGTHVDGYYNYMLYKTDGNRFRLHRDPFYLQLFKNAIELCPGTDPMDSWKMPEWFPLERSVAEAEAFERRYGGGPVVIFSPYVADQSCVQDNASSFGMEYIFEELRKWNLPVIATGTKWDVKDFPAWVIDGYSPTLSLGGLFYLIQNRAALVVSPNSGIGFAAHWLEAPTLMIDNRTGWKEQVEVWRQKVQHLDDSAGVDERRWPPFVKEMFHPQHLTRAPFEQIVWDADEFVRSLKIIQSSIHRSPDERRRLAIPSDVDESWRSSLTAFSGRLRYESQQLKPSSGGNRIAELEAWLRRVRAEIEIRE